jgi:hypothetical protein
MENSQNSFSVPKLLLEMGCFRFGNGFFSFAKGKKYLKNYKISLILTCVFSHTQTGNSPFLRAILEQRSCSENFPF